MKGKLYITATPIGNLEDITFRAVRILKEADFIACEDTRESMKLLKHFGIHTPLLAFHKFSTRKETEAIADRIEKGENCALITDAGTPCISDPGSSLVALAAEKGITVESVPGPCAFICALTLSGFGAQAFAFAGFPPRKPGELRRFIAEAAKNTVPTGIYEAPGRVKKTLETISEVIPERRLSFSRELTKLHEETVRGTAAEVLKAYEGREIRGEGVIIIDGSGKTEETADVQEALERLETLTASGMSPRDAIDKCAAETG
ncbi:MAG: 16S rRNA (cytidine(1402)-2'-O)-methyltransferase, partial [Abditibacteriota bacterium]|nr:16S rRNA (cytidine(1402)-2'-O)-methyltransferase [Abditibacteriota bacterium]